MFAWKAGNVLDAIMSRVTSRNENKIDGLNPEKAEIPWGNTTDNEVFYDYELILEWFVDTKLLSGSDACIYYGKALHQKILLA